MVTFEISLVSVFNMNSYARGNLTSVFCDIHSSIEMQQLAQLFTRKHMIVMKNMMFLFFLGNL